MIGDILHRLILGPLELLFDVVYTLGFRATGSPGLSIVVLSLLINLMLLPMHRRADAVQKEERQQAERLKPGIEKIKRVFRGDERFMILQTYYRQNQYKPYYVLKGSVSLLLEVPFFMAAYGYLSHLGLLQGAAFGPIQDLGKPDGLINLSFGTFHLLPILMTAISLASAAVYTRGQPLRSKIQLYGMTLLFLVLLYRSPSGLTLYWTLNNAFSLCKNLIQKSLPGTAESGTAAGSLKDSRADDRHVKPVFYSCCMLMTLLLGVLIPSAVVNASPGEFVVIREFHSPIRYVVFSALMAAGACMIWAPVFFALASGKGRRRLACGAVVLCAAAAMNYVFFGNGYGNLSPTLKYDIPLTVLISDSLLNLCAVLAVLGIILLIWKKKREVLKMLCIAGCVSFCVMSVLNIRGILSEASDLAAVAEQERQKPEPSFSMSREGKNVVVIMLDRYISGFIPYLLEENPTLAGQLRGFTYYPNTLSFGRNTNVCTPSLYGGYEYRPFELDKRINQSLPEKQNEALKVMPVLFMENGFEVTVCDPPYAGYLWVPDLSIYDGYPEIRRFNTNGAFTDDEEAFRKKDRTLQRNLFCYSVFRSAPVLLQTELYNGGKYNEADAQMLAPGEEYGAVFSAESATRSSGISEEFMKAWTALQHLPDMTGIVQSGEESADQEKTSETEKEVNTFLILSNTATHDVTLLQEPAFEPAPVVDNTDYEEAHQVRTSASGGKLELKTLEQMEHYQCDMAAMIQLGKWFDLLREKGVWDNTRIIVVSDHGWELGLNHILTGREEGENALSPYDGIMAYNALMMIKDFGSGEEFRTDGTFMTIADTPAEAMRGLIENPVNPFTGHSISEEAKNEEEQYVMLTDWRIAENHGIQYSDPVRLTLKNGFVFDENNWIIP